MDNEIRVYHQHNKGWFIEAADGVEGPMESRQEAMEYSRLLELVVAARSSEVVCLDKECFL